MQVQAQRTRSCFSNLETYLYSKKPNRSKQTKAATLTLLLVIMVMTSGHNVNQKLERESHLSALHGMNLFILGTLHSLTLQLQLR